MSELDSLFRNRSTNCAIKANRYWISQQKEREQGSKINHIPTQNWFENISKDIGASRHNEDTFDLLIMVVSVRRRQGSYLLHVTRLLHEQIQDLTHRKTNDHRKNVHLVICNSDADLEKHEDAVYLSQFVDVVQISRANRSHKCCTSQTW